MANSGAGLQPLFPHSVELGSSMHSAPWRIESGQTNPGRVMTIAA